MRASGPGAMPGLVATSKATRSRPRGPHSRSLQCLDAGDESRLAEAQRLQFAGDRRVEPAARGGAGRAQPARRRAVMPRGFRLLLAQPRHHMPAVLQRGQPQREVLLKPGEIVDRDRVLAGERAQREQALLDVLQLPGVEIGVGHRAFQQGLRLDRLRQRPVEGADGRIEAAFHLVGDAPNLPQRRAESLDRAAPSVAGELAGGLADGLPQLFRVQQQRAPVRQLGFFPGPRRQRGQLLHSVPEVILVAARLLEVRFGARPCLRSRPPGAPGGGAVVRLRRESAERVEQRSMLGRIQQTLIIELPMDFDERSADLAKQSHAHRLVVHEGLRAAVAVQDAPQQHPGVAAVEALLAQQFARGVAGAEIECRR